MGYKLFFKISICTTFYPLVLRLKPYMKNGGLFNCNVHTLSCCGICDSHLRLDYCKNVVESVRHSGRNSRWKP